MYWGRPLPSAPVCGLVSVPAPSSLNQTLCSPRLCPLGSSSVLLSLCHCFSYLIFPSTTPPSCTHRCPCTRTHVCTHTHTHRFLCWLQQKLVGANFALMFGVRVGRGEGQVATLIRCPNGVSEGASQSHSYFVGSLVFPARDRVGLEVSRFSPHPTRG